MDDFFAPPPERDPEPVVRYRSPAWAGPPDGALPGIVPLELVLARSDVAAVGVSHLAAYPAGFSFEVVAICSYDLDDADPFLFDARRARSRAGAGELPPEMLRLGVQFPDGTKATNTGGWRSEPGEPTAPLMEPRGGGGSDIRWKQEMWVWPLPQPGEGPLLIACEWPVADIPLTTHRLDPDAIWAAAARAQVVFDDEGLPEWPDDDDDGPTTNAIR